MTTPTADSEIVRWYAERFCAGDLAVAFREVARWSVGEARHWWRVAFGGEPMGADSG